MQCYLDPSVDRSDENGEETESRIRKTKRSSGDENEDEPFRWSLSQSMSVARAGAVPFLHSHTSKEKGYTTKTPL